MYSSPPLDEVYAVTRRISARATVRSPNRSAHVLGERAVISGGISLIAQKGERELNLTSWFRREPGQMTLPSNVCLIPLSTYR